jgi:methyltransferase (TIGR00027 family)
VLADRGAEPRCERVALPVDLRRDWAAELVGAGFDPGAPTAWLAEGLLIYLSADEAGRLLTAVGELSAPGGTLSFEHDPGSPLADARKLPSMRQYAAMWKGGLGPAAPGWLAGHGWRPRLHDMAALAASYGRPASGASGGFLTAVRVPA